MPNHHHYAAISFDVGFTLIEPYREPTAIVTGLLEELELTPDDATLHAAYHRAERLFVEDYLRPLGDTWTADERILQFYRRYYDQLLRDLGVDQPDPRYADAIITRYLDPANWRLYPQVLETLMALHEQGYRLGIASDWGVGLPRILHTLGLSRYLDWALVSALIGAAKPSPQFYRLVVQRAGMPADRIVHVGDSYYGDVLGARTVGITPVLIDWRRRSWPKLDVPVIHELAALPALLAAM